MAITVPGLPFRQTEWQTRCVTNKPVEFWVFKIPQKLEIRPAHVSQLTFTIKLIDDMSKADTELSAIPVIEGIYLNGNIADKIPVNSTHCRYLADMLMYTTASTHPTVAFATGLFAKNANNPCQLDPAKAVQVHLSWG